MRAGDIVFVRGKSPIATLIRLFDKGSFSHVAVAVSETHIIEAEWDTKARIAKMEYDDFEIIDLGLTDKQRDIIVHEGIDLVGMWYDYLQIVGYIFFKDMGSPKSLICSELAYILLNKVGIDIKDRHIKPNELYKRLKSI